MAAYGLRPCVEIQFADYMYPAYDQIVSEAARLRHRSAGDFTAPLVVRMPTGGGIFGGQTHSQSPEALFTHVAGLKTVVVSNPYDAKGLLIASIEDDDPVIFLEPKRVYNGPFDGHHDRPIVPVVATPAVARCPKATTRSSSARHASTAQGSDLTVLAYGTLVHVAQAAADEHGIDAEIIDLRTLVPLDVDTIVASVEKTGRCLVVHEATLTSGFGAELSATVQERCFFHLEAPVTRVCGWDTPYPHAHEWSYFPGPDRVGRAMKEVRGVVSVYTVKLPDVGEGVAEAELVSWLVAVGDAVTPESPHRRGAHRQGDGRDLVAGRRRRRRAARRARRRAGGRQRSRRHRDRRPRRDRADRGPAGRRSVARRRRPRRHRCRHRTEPARIDAAPAERTASARGARRCAPGRASWGSISPRSTAPGPTVAWCTPTSTEHSPVAASGRPRATATDRRARRTDARFAPTHRRAAVGGLDRDPAHHLRRGDRRDRARGAAGRAEPRRRSATRLTMLPFLVRAIAIACRDQPRLNAHYDHASEMLSISESVHVGIATQTDDGLMVPVVRHAERSTAPRPRGRDRPRHRRRARGSRHSRGAVGFDDHRHVTGCARRHRDHADPQPSRGRDRRCQQTRDPTRCGATVSSSLGRSSTCRRASITGSSTAGMPPRSCSASGRCSRCRRCCSSTTPDAARRSPSAVWPGVAHVTFPTRVVRVGPKHGCHHDASFRPQDRRAAVQAVREGGRPGLRREATDRRPDHRGALGPRRHRGAGLLSRRSRGRPGDRGDRAREPGGAPRREVGAVRARRPRPDATSASTPR